MNESEVVATGSIEITYSIVRYPGEPDMYDVLSGEFESDEWFPSAEEALEWIKRKGG